MNHIVFSGGSLVRCIHGEEFPLRLDVDRAPYEQHRFVRFQLRLVHRDAFSILFRDAARQCTEPVHPVVNGDVAGLNQAGLERHRTIGEACHVEETGMDLGLEGTFISQKYMALTNGPEKNVECFHSWSDESILSGRSTNLAILTVSRDGGRTLLSVSVEPG